jgi:hypothetical protein
MNARGKAFFAIGLIAALSVFGAPIFAQQQGPKAGEKIGVGYFSGGVGWILESGDSSMVYSAGGGGHTIANKWILGGEGHSCFGSDNAGGFGFFDLGYLLLRGDFVLVYPLLGLGGGAMTSAIGSEVSKCALLNPAVCADFLIPMKNRSGILLGLHGGYTFTVYSNTFTWSMPHIRVIIGGYGFGE